MPLHRRLMQHVRLVLMCFVLGVLVNAAAPAGAAAGTWDLSVCSAVGSTSPGGEGMPGGHSHLDCSLCAPTAAGLPPAVTAPTRVRLPEERLSAWNDAGSPASARRKAHARGPPPP